MKSDSATSKCPRYNKHPGSLKRQPLKWAIGILFALSTLGLISGCASVKAKKPQKDMRPVVEEVSIRPGGPEKKDSLQQAYENYTLASVALKEGRYEEAKTYLEKAIIQDPDSAYLNTRMALLLKGLKDYEKALSYARKSAEADPKDMDNLALMGIFMC